MKDSDRGALDFSPKRKALLEALLRREGIEAAAPGKIRRETHPEEASGVRRCPLSFAQERLWFMDRLTPGNPVFNLGCNWKFTCPDITVLQRTVNELVRRHESLRTTFGSTDGEPVQIVAVSAKVPVDVRDLQELPRTARDAAVLRIAAAEARKPFDLAEGPLLRTVVLRLGGDEYVFLLTMHHIISDGWSLRVFRQELMAIWAAFDADEPSPLEALDIQYPDFALWQRGWLTGSVLQTQTDYWKRQLAALGVLQLRTDRVRPPVQSANSATLPLTLTPTLSLALIAFSHDRGVTLFMTLLAAFQTLLCRYTGQEDIAIGTFIANRARAEVEKLIGLFVNTLVLRGDLTGTPSFTEVLLRVRLTTLDAFAHQDLPFAKLVQELQPERDLGRNPLFQIAFQLQTPPSAAAAASCVSASATHSTGADIPVSGVQRGAALLDMTWSLRESADGVAGEIEYNRDLFDAGTVERMAVHYRNLLLDILARPDAAIADLALIDEAERHQLLVEWNATRADYPSEASLPSLFESRAACSAEQTAFLCGGETAVTYGELNRRANRLSRQLQGLGVVLETRVGICMSRSIDNMVGLLAILKAGGAYVPLDPGYPADRLAYMMQDAGIEILLSEERLLAGLPRGGARILCRERWEAAGDDGNPAVPIGPDNLAYVLYTSGSTGRPKGVLGMHRGVVNRLSWMWASYPFGPDEVGCARTSLNFVDSVWEMFGPLLQGVPTVIFSDDVLRDPTRLVDELAHYRVSRIWLVPSLLRALLDLYDDLQQRLPHLLFWVTSGEALTPALLQRFRAQMPDAVLYNLYGTTEIWDATWFDPTRAIAGDRAPIGRPIANVQAYVLDERRQPVPLGVPGELYIGGVGLARGYHQLPDLTAEKFVAHPFSTNPDARLYRTGDLVRYLHDGQIEFLGRRDRQIKIRGSRIEPAEVEAVLLRHPGVRQAAVLLRQDSSREPALAAYIVKNLDYDGAELRQGVHSWSADRVLRWQEVWNEIFSKKPASGDRGFNFAGYNSSYTGSPIADDEMREWLDRSVASVLSLDPRDVLEIGCGTGALMFRLAPHATRYCAADFSPAAVSYVRAELRARDLPHVEVLLCAADDFSGFVPASFDTVVLNSVSQYFPSIDYFSSVLEGAIDVLRPGGAIYIGAVRSLALLEAFHTSVELQRASALLPLAQLRQRIGRCMAEEDELAIDPAYFRALMERHPRIRSVTVEPKRGRFQNELTRFRYEVVLRLDSPLHGRQAGCRAESRDWRADRMSLFAIEAMLREGGPDQFAVMRIPNARLSADIRAVELLASLHGRNTVGDLRTALDAVHDLGVDPEALWRLADSTPYSVQLEWARAGANECFDALISRRDAAPTGHTLDALDPAAQGDAAPASNASTACAYSNKPLDHMLPQVLVPELRRFAQAALPAHMVPSSFVLLDSLPLTPSGKLDQTALPAPDRSRPERKSGYVAPRTRSERQIADIWMQLLGVDRIGAHDNFFLLGGHSLLATRLLSRMRETFHRDLPLRAIFETPSIAGLGQLVEDTLARGEKAETPAMVRLSREAHATTLSPDGVVDAADLSMGRRKERSRPGPAP